jgi:starvation-inducible DNA-binding protein
MGLAFMFKTKIDISQDRRVQLNSLMNQRPADAVDLQTQMKQAHWNMKGPHFIGPHELFDQIDFCALDQNDWTRQRR